ncbi:hypothetical protein NDU88_004711 [Pleurodeles waltl]|uniref:Reverse transcriptase/retrotransposon-derived protein RNase H-like domain-containing protein n=1 Tax=Pleurodeles waltl TaxID=8319 RepID=A0AAV7VJY9_PLEWA|nr:hypothetical protein NDU88_004711 [Pleurodeles waltl]
MEGDSPRRPPLCPGSQITSAHVSARGRNPDRVRDLVPSGGYSPPGAQSRRTTTGRSFSQAPGPSPAPPPPRQGSPGVARRLGPSAFSPPQAASPGKAAASALRSGPRPRAPPIGRFRSPALSRIAVGAHPRSAPSANTASLPGPRSVRRRRGPQAQAVLSQKKANGEWTPEAYVSRALTETEQRYSNTEKEAIANASTRRGEVSRRTLQLHALQHAETLTGLPAGVRAGAVFLRIRSAVLNGSSPASLRGRFWRFRCTPKTKLVKGEVGA